MQFIENAVLLVNLGSPNALTASEIKKFLTTFLLDRRVVNLPKILWYPLLRFVILPRRTPKLIKQYTAIWYKPNTADAKSPLIKHTEDQVHELTKLISDNDKSLVLHAFSYSAPFIAQQLQYLHEKYKVKNLYIVPLYPQFSTTTTLAIFDQITEFYQNKSFMPSLKFVADFHDNEDYILAIVNKITASWEINGRAEKLVFSYHSLPQKIIDNGDVYLTQCLETSKLIATRLGLSSNNYITTFQSKFGRARWLTPATNTTLIEFAEKGVSSIDIICPGFIVDCLETLEEINQLNRDLFIQHGGKQYNYISCLNSDLDLIHMIKKIILSN